MSDTNPKEWQTLDGTTFAEDPLKYLGQVWQGNAFMITAEDELIAFLVPIPKEHSVSSATDPTSSEE